MHELLRSLESFIREHDLRGKKLLIAVSGGADSMALLHGLHQLGPAWGLDLRAAHLNHQLRGAASDEDAYWLKATCAALSIGLTVGTEDVRRACSDQGTGIEEGARAARYRFLEATAHDLSRPLIAVAHSANDQAETILHHIVRGTGLAGLRGMPVCRKLVSGATLIRPLLKVDRTTIRGYLPEVGQDFREDASNQDETYTRNRIRHRLLPLLEQEFNSHVSEALCRLGQQAEESQQALDLLARELLDRALTHSEPQECRLCCKALHSQPRHLVREVFIALWRRFEWPRQKMGYAHWDQLVDIAWTGGAATLPGNIDVRRTGSELMLRFVGTMDNGKA